MKETKPAQKLISLIQLDIDAVHAYEQAIKNIDVEIIRNRLSEYKEDHQRHVRDLSSQVRSEGETPPEYSPDFKGFLIKGFTALQSAMGTYGALKAMQMNEKLTNKKYSEASRWEVPFEAKSIIERNYEDEKRHLRYVEEFVEEFRPERRRLAEWGSRMTERIKNNPVAYSIGAAAGFGALIWLMMRRKEEF